MKKTITILILSLLFFSQIGYRFIYLVQQHQLKEAAEEQLLGTLKDDQFEIIDATANQKDLRWEEEGKEFYLNGQLYDVAKSKVVDGKTLLYCLNDKKEEQLLKDLSKTIQSNTDNGSGNKSSKHTLKLQLSDFTLLQASTNVEAVFAVVHYPDFTVPVHTVIKKVHTPPPNNNLYFQKSIL